MKSLTSPYILVSIICTFAAGGLAYHWTKRQFNADIFVAVCAFVSTSLTVHLFLLLAKMKLTSKNVTEVVDDPSMNDLSFLANSNVREKEIWRVRGIIQNIATDKLDNACKDEWIRVFDDFVSGKPLARPFVGYMPLTNDEITRIYYRTWKILKIRGGLQTANFIKRTFPEKFESRSAQTIYRKMAAVECYHLDRYFEN